MRWKSTLVLLAAAILIGAYISLYEIKQPTSQERLRQSRYALRLDPDAVTQIVLDLPKAKAALTRVDNRWTLAPGNVRADSGQVGQILTVASALFAQRVLTPSAGRPLALKEFGLEPASGWISLAVNRSVTTLMIGDRTPIGDSRYVKRADRPDVFIVDGQFFKVLDKPLESFREAALLPLSASQCKSIELKSAAAAWKMDKIGESWQFAAPHADKADQQAVSQFLAQLGQLAVRKFIDDTPAVEQLAQWGFDHPKAELIIQTDEAAAATTLFFGNPLPGDPTLIYAKRNDEQPLYAVPASDVQQLLKDADSLRLKKLFNFFTANVTKVTAAWSGATWTMEKNPLDQWALPGSADALDRERVEEFLNALANGRAAGFVDGNSEDLKRYGLDAPIGTLMITVNSAPSEQQLLIGALVPKSRNRYGKVAGRNALMTLPEELVTLLSKTNPEKLKTEPPALKRASE